MKRFSIENNNRTAALSDYVKSEMEITRNALENSLRRVLDSIPPDIGSLRDVNANEFEKMLSYAEYQRGPESASRLLQYYCAARAAR